MSSICFRCALRLRISESSRNQLPSKRAFTSSTARRKGPLPHFTPTSQPELDDVLASLRDKWLIPAALSNQERNLIYKPKYKAQLLQNPEVVTIGDEDVELHHIDRFADVPSLKSDLLPKIIDMMVKGERSDWNNLPSLLAGLTKAKLTPRREVMGKIARKAIEAGRFGIILQCLQQAELTQMTLRKREVLSNVLYALRDIAQRDEWSEAATSKAMREANAVATLLEETERASGKSITKHDPRTSPDVLAVYLELSAVYAYKHQEARDVDGKVKTYASRLLSNMSVMEQTSSDEASKGALKSRPSITEPVSIGPQTDILRGISLYHGLSTAIKILGDDMPHSEVAQSIVTAWENGLISLTQGLRDQAKDPLYGRKRWPKSGTYGGQALKAWRSCTNVEKHLVKVRTLPRKPHKRRRRRRTPKSDPETQPQAQPE